MAIKNRGIIINPRFNILPVLYLIYGIKKYATHKPATNPHKNHCARMKNLSSLVLLFLFSIISPIPSSYLILKFLLSPIPANSITITSIKINSIFLHHYLSNAFILLFKFFPSYAIFPSSVNSYSFASIVSRIASSLVK